MTDLGIGPGNAFQTRQKVVVSRLREAILRGSFAPGERLDQKEISERLKVSRSPVRQALRTLAVEGLVEVIPHRGAVVAELSPDKAGFICGRQYPVRHRLLSGQLEVHHQHPLMTSLSVNNLCDSV